MKAFNRFVVDHPWQVIAGFVLATMFFAVRVPDLVVDFDMDRLFPPENEEIAYRNWMVEYFAIEDPVIVLIVNDGSNGVFTPETLALTAFLSEEMKTVEGMDGDDIISLAEIDDITADDDSLRVAPFFDEPPATQAQADAVRAAVFSNPMMIGTVVSADGRATIVGGELLPDARDEDVLAELKDIVARASHGDSVLRIVGRPVIENEMVALNNTEMRRVIPLVVVTAAVVLALSLHSIRGVLLPLLVVVTSVLWTLGLMAWTGSVFSALNSPLPMMLIPIGIADGIHVIHHYMHTVAKDPNRPNADAVFDTMQSMFVAVVMTSLTTAAGVASLAASSISTNREFGLFSAFGVLAAMVFSLTVLPAILTVSPRPRRGLASLVGDADDDRGPLRYALRIVADLVTTRPRLILAVTFAAMVVSVLGFPRLTVDGSLLKNLPPDNAVLTADNLMVERFGGSLPLEISVDGGDADAWKQPENLRAMLAFQDGLERIDKVGATRSLADVVRRLNAVMNPNDPEADRIPDSADAVAQYLLLYSISGEPNDFDDVVDYDYALANIRAQVASDHSPALGEILRSIDDLEREHLEPLGLKAHASGAMRQVHEFMHLIVSSQLASLTTAVILVWAMSALMLSSVLGGLLTALPVILATVATFGGLGWIREPVGVTTSIMCAIAIGIGIDYAVHFVVRYRDCRRDGLDTDLAMRKTLQTSGVAIYYNAIVVIAGFMAMATSNYLPPQAMGYLVSWNMVICFVSTLTTLAALLVLLDPKFVSAPEKQS